MAPTHSRKRQLKSLSNRQSPPFRILEKSDIDIVRLIQADTTRSPSFFDHKDDTHANTESLKRG